MRLELLTMLAAVALCSCGSTGVLPPTYPENIGAEPRGTVGVVAPATSTTLSTALRALGVPHRVFPNGEINESQLDGLALVVIDESAFDDLAAESVFAVG